MIYKFYPYFQEEKNLKTSHLKTSIILFYNQKKIILDLEKY